MSRHVAESILLSKSIPDGTYLIRDSSNSDCTLTMSVRYAQFSHYTTFGFTIITYATSSSSVGTVSNKCCLSYKTSVKHYRIVWDGKDLCFGLGKFRTVSEFVEHFESQPIISGESGYYY